MSLTFSLSDSFNEYNQIINQKNNERKTKDLQQEQNTQKTTQQQRKFSLKNFNRCLKKITVEPVTFCYACALILHAPLIQQYIYHKTSLNHGLPSCITNEVSSCDLSKEMPDSPVYNLRKEVQSITSYMYLGIILSAAVPSLVMALLLGSWSDRVGRKIVIFLPVLGGLLETICVLVTMVTEAPLYLLFLGSFMNGMCGFFTTMVLAVFSYIADITEEDERALRLGILEAVAFTSGMISHMTSGWWIRHLGFKAPYIFIFCLHTISLIYIIAYLPDTKHGEKSRLVLKDLIDKEHIKKVLVVFKNAPSANKWQLYGLALISAFMMIANIGFGSVIVLFALDSPFCFSPIMIGYFLADCMFMQALGAIFALVVLQKYLSETMLTQLGIVSIISSLVMIALIKKRWHMFLVPVVGCFGGVCMPVIRAKMSKLVHASQQGALFASVATLETLCTLCGAAIFNSLYPYSVKKMNFKGFCFLVMAALQFIPAVIICILAVLPSETGTKKGMSSTEDEVEVKSEEEVEEEEEKHCGNEHVIKEKKISTEENELKLN